MTRRVLMASWLFAPNVSIGAKRAVRFARWLPTFGWAPTVLCRRVTPASQRDPSPVALPPEVTVLRAYDHPFFARFANTEATPPPAAPATPAHEPLARPWRARAEERWKLLVDAMVPTDTVAIHAPHAMAKLDALAPSHDLLWTTSYPYHTHALGLAVARQRRKPWVVDLRDPWTPNWVHHRKFPHARYVESWLERAVVEGADAVVVTTEALAELYRAMFPAHAGKFRCIHNAFDPVGDDAPPPDVRGPGEPRRLVHFGNVYGPWSFETLYRALAQLRREGSLPPVVLENYGKLSDRDRALAASHGVGDVVRVLPPLPFDRGLARLRGADALLLAGWDDPDARLYVQGKAFDYLAAARPVLAESAHPDIRRIVEDTRAGTVVAPGDVRAMADALRPLLRDDAAPPARDEAAVSYYSAREATARLASLFDEVIRT
ncbi:MAG: glycosyltransferase [Polyangiales bacterium]